MTPVLIWTEGGVTLQTYDAGRMCLSGLGRLGLEDARRFCAFHGIDFVASGPGRSDRAESYGWSDPDRTREELLDYLRRHPAKER